jgi:hypothetical protein
LEVALKMKVEIDKALKEEKADLEELKAHQELIKAIISALQKDFDVSSLKNKY